MNKAIQLKAYLLLLVLSLLGSNILAQDIQTYNNGVLKGALKVKLKPELVVSSGGLKSSTVSGYSSVGIEKIDMLNFQYQAVQMERLFPYSPKFDARHRKHGLHLWYTIKVESEEDIQKIVKAYGNIQEIDLAEPFYEKSLVPYSIKEVNSEASSALKNTTTSPYNDPRFDEQWHYHNTEDNPGTSGADINLLKAWEKQVGHPDVIVAVIDQGVDYKHEDLAANMWVNEAELNGTPGEDSDGNGYIDDIYGFDFVNMEGDVKALPHGTHVAGTVAAVNNNGIGVAGVAGGSGNDDGVRIMSCMIMSESAGGSAEAAFVYAADNGAVIAQNSWGWNEPDIYEQSILDAIDYFIEEAGQFENSPMKGGVVLFASGNNGHEAKYWPGCYENVIAVAATGKDNEVVPYTNYGDWIDISAPGGNVDNSQNYGVLSTLPDNKYGFYDGTSMACPHVSGVAGLIVSEYKGAEFDKEMLWSRLLSGVNVLDTMAVNLDYDGKVGLGGVDAYLALQQDNGIAPDVITDFTNEGASSTFAYFSWTVPVDEDDDQPRYFKIYYSKHLFDASNVGEVESKRFNSNLNAGDTFNYELRDISPSIKYYVAVTAIDRWGNESDLSTIIEVQTNNGPQIQISPERLEFDIDVQVDTISNQSFTITNTGEGLLKWDTKAHHVGNVDIYSTLETRAPYKLNVNNVTIPAIEDYKVEGEADISLYAQRPENRYMHYFDAALLTQTLAAIGETNKDLPNSSAVHFEIFNPVGWNLTGVEVGLFFDEAPDEHLYVEVYEGGDIKSARLIHTQTFYAESSGPFFQAIDFDKQMFFEQGDEFFIVFHVPPGNKYPFLGSQGLTMGSTDHQYISNDQGETWDLLRDVYYDYTKVWDVIALNELVELDTYLKLSPSSGYLKPDESTVIDLTINASQLINGDYRSDVDIFGEGYAENWKTLELDFSVTGQTHQIESTDIVNFGNVFIGENKTEQITIFNNGLGAFGDDSGPLEIIIEDEDFSLIGAMPRVIPGERSSILEFYFTPSKVGPINSKVTILNSDGDQHVFYLYGAGTKPAKALVTPPIGQFSDLVLGDGFSGEFTLTNEGDYPLRYYIPKFADGSNMPDFDPNSIHKFGYIGNHKEAANGQEAFEWIDIQNTGVDITDHFRLDGSVIFKDVLLGFSFPYFGSEYDTCYITTQGAVSMAKNGWFNARPAGYKNPAQPSKLISAWGMPFNLNDGGKILYQKFPGKFIIQYQDVIHGSYFYDNNIPGGIGWLDENITFQIVLHQNGDIDLNYKDLGEILGTRPPGFNRASTLIMIEDNDVDDRLVLNGYGTKGIHPFIEGIFPATGKQIFFKNPGFGVIAEITNPYGTVSVGESVTISYTGSTEELYVADFEERINIVSNDPINNPVTHTIAMNITQGGLAEFTFNQPELDFGDVFQGAVQTIDLRIGNDGKAIGRFESMSFNNELFTVEGYMPVELRPGTFADYTITVVAEELGEKNDILTFTTDGGDTYQIDVKCNVVEAPIISADQNEIISTIQQGQSEIVNVTINNTGLNDMIVTPGGNEWMQVLPNGYESQSAAVDYTYTIEHGLESTYYTRTDVVETGSKLETPSNVLDPSTFWMTVPMPYEVSYYGEKYDTLYVGVTGVITFLPDQLTREWGPGFFIPNEAGINGYLAPMFGFNGPSNTDYYPLSGIYTKAYDDKFVLRYQDMGSNGGGKPLSVEVWILKNGTIKYFYELEDELLSYIILNGSLVGIENQDGTKGIQVSARTTGVIRQGTVITFIPFETYSVAAQSSQDFDVHLSAKSIYSGTYTDQLIFSNNTPDAPEFSIPVTLEVIGQDSIVVTDTLSLGELMMIDHDNEGYISPYKRYDFEFTLNNQGTRNLFINNVKMMNGFNSGIVMGDDTKFGSGSAEDGWVDISRKRINYTLKPLSRETFNLRVIPMEEGLINDTILVYCDLDDSPIKIPVSAIFTLPPVFNIQSEGVHVYADTNEHEESRSFVVDNNNGSTQLDYEVSLVFERNVSPMENMAKQAAVTTQSMPSVNASKLEYTNVSSLKQSVSSNNDDFNQVLQYENVTSSNGNVGFGGSAISFTSATGFFAPSEGFNLSHVMTWYAWGDVLDSYVEVSILGGSEDYLECEVLYTQRYHHIADVASSNGELITIELDENLYFFSGEKFFVQFQFDEFIGYPQGTHSGNEEVYQRYYFGSGSDMFETTEQGYGTMGWITRAAEIEAGGNPWSILDTNSTGSIAHGEELELVLDFNSAFAQQGLNLASVVFKTNDPYSPETKLPVSLTRNKGPQYADGFDVNKSMLENDTLLYTLVASDEEGDVFTLKVLEDKPHFTYEQKDSEIAFVFTPDFDAAGQHSMIVEGEDSFGNVTQFKLTVDVINVNQTPVEAPEIGEQIFALENEDGYIIDLDDYISNPDGGALTYKVSYQHPEMMEMLHTDNTLVFIPKNLGYTYVSVTAEDEEGAKLETGFPVFVEHRTGINEELANAIRTFPNPVIDVLHIKVNDVEVSKYQLLDISGNMLRSNSNINDLREISINMSEYNAGMYLLKIYSGDEILVKKITKQ